MTLATIARPGTGKRAALRRIDRALGLAAEVPAALLVVAEIVLLSAGVVSRYVFQSPLTWSDELASALFLWLAMLGAVIALAPRRAHAADRVRQPRAPRRPRVAGGVRRRRHRRLPARPDGPGRAVHDDDSGR